MIEEDYNVVLYEVCSCFGVMPEAIKSRDRHRRSAYARALIAIRLRKKEYSYPAIAAVLKRNHTSVMRMCLLNPREVEAVLRSMMTEADIDRAMEALKIIQPDEKPIGCPIKAQWDRAVRTYHRSPRDIRERVWEESCKQMFPLTWQAQVLTPPHLGASQ